MNVTRNKTADYFRKHGTRLQSEESIERDDAEEGAEEALYRKNHGDLQQFMVNVPEDLFVNQEKQAMLREIVAQLKPDQKQIVMLHCFEDRTFKEIAQIMEMSENSVKTKFYSALNKLEKAILEKEEKEGIRLHSASIASLLLFLFWLVGKSNVLSGAQASAITAGVSEGISQAAKGAVVGSASNASGQAVAAGSSKAAAGASAASKSPAAAGAVAKASGFAGKKIIIGLVAAAVVAGGIATGVTLGQNLGEKDPEKTQEAEAEVTEEIVEENVETIFYSCNVHFYGVDQVGDSFQIEIGDFCVKGLGTSIYVPTEDYEQFEEGDTYDFHTGTDCYCSSKDSWLNGLNFETTDYDSSTGEGASYWLSTFDSSEDGVRLYRTSVTDEESEKYFGLIPMEPGESEAGSENNFILTINGSDTVTFLATGTEGDSSQKGQQKTMTFAEYFNCNYIRHDKVNGNFYGDTEPEKIYLFTDLDGNITNIVMIVGTLKHCN